MTDSPSIVDLSINPNLKSEEPTEDVGYKSIRRGSFVTYDFDNQEEARKHSFFGIVTPAVRILENEGSIYCISRENSEMINPEEKLMGEDIIIITPDMDQDIPAEINTEIKIITPDVGHDITTEKELKGKEESKILADNDEKSVEKSGE